MQKYKKQEKHNLHDARTKCDSSFKRYNNDNANALIITAMYHVPYGGWLTAAAAAATGIIGFAAAAAAAAPEKGFCPCLRRLRRRRQLVNVRFFS